MEDFEATVRLAYLFEVINNPIIAPTIAPAYGLLVKGQTLLWHLP